MEKIDTAAKLLNKNLKAIILVNGFTTESINIEQSVKQGDALLCSLFILCMDPLIRKGNGDKFYCEIDSLFYLKNYLKTIPINFSIFIKCYAFLDLRINFY